MNLLGPLSSLTSKQRGAIIACYLGWTLDAFDFFILIFVISDVAKEFKTPLGPVTYAVGLTLMMRPLGALIFGLIADRFGRRPTLMFDVLLYSAVELLSGFAPTLTVLIVLRAIYGVAMGGEWGVGASLTMETIPVKSRGFVSGILQAGYPSGYLIASILYGTLYHYIGWRGMFMVGALPALLVLYIRRSVEESPSWTEQKHEVQPILPRLAKGSPVFLLIILVMAAVWIFPGLTKWFPLGLSEQFFFLYAILLITASVLIGGITKKQLSLFFYVILLMTCFNFFSHGSQDLYPTFLKVQRQFSPAVISTIAIIYNIGAILGGIVFGSISERVGRKRTIVVAALFALPVIPLWAFSQSPAALAFAAFVMQFLVQGAWGVVPVHLNELSPGDVRGTFPGFTYQLGNLFASYNLTWQAATAQHFNGNFALAMAIFMGVIAIGVALVTSLGPEARGVHFGKTQPDYLE